MFRHPRPSRSPRVILVSFRHPTRGSTVGLQTPTAELIDLQPLIPGPLSGLSAIRRLLEATGGRPRFGIAELDGLPRVPIDDVEVEPIVPDPTKVVRHLHPHGAATGHPGRGG